MFFALLRRLRRNVVFRLSLWYALIFAVSTAVLFAMIYYWMAQEFERKDQDLLLSRLKEFHHLPAAHAGRDPGRHHHGQQA